LIYVLNELTLIKKSNVNEFKKIKKIVLPEERSVDIDTMAG